ncbi:ABC transporter substrate-binding protein [Poseidonocella sp. HB161398]|uniref:ABC transporter substrate-binding protein n=1 Tax=Poseidonocella sp. HB161398 TaxID=2320855 RepID=UPI0011085A8B|nr:ABC transporter substrate-binding protein [Poseidonocella sp. HB161398]
MTRILGSSALALACLAGAAWAQDLVFEPGEGGFHWDSYEALKSVDLSGQVITVAGPWLSQERDYFESVLAYFETATGADVQYNGSDSFEQQIVIDTAAGSAPDIAIFPQPGLAADLAAKGFLVPLPAETADWVAENYAAGQSWVDLATFPGKDGAEALYGVFYRVDLKSLVWYVPENFEDLGLEIPETMEELKAMTQAITDEGETPWCIGLGSGGATGWPATDWVEDLMLRMYPPEVYDAWVTNEMPFDDPKVVAAIEEFGWFARDDAFVAGGTGAVASTDFRDSPKGLFSVPPQCYMHRQASFIPSFFPEGTVVGEDADFFYFPSYGDRDLGKPVLGAGTLVSMTRDTPGARAFMEFVQSPIAHEIWMAQRAFISAHLGTNPDLYGDPTMGKMAEILRGADTFRFDGSDVMPAAIGAGVFWTGMVDYAGGAPAAEVAASIQSTWDGIK